MTDIITNADKLAVGRLRAILSYDPDSGVFRFLVPRGTRSVGAIAGSPSSSGYIQINIDRRKYHAHRLAWLYGHGQWPTNQIDHIDGDPSNNRLKNLREATQSQNNRNSRLRKNSSSGLKGAYFFKRDRCWMSAIKVDGRQLHLGYFDTKQEAHAAYVAAARIAAGQFMRTE